MATVFHETQYFETQVTPEFNLDWSAIKYRTQMHWLAMNVPQDGTLAECGEHFEDFDQHETKA